MSFPTSDDVRVACRLDLAPRLDRVPRLDLPLTAECRRRLRCMLSNHMGAQRCRRRLTSACEITKEHKSNQYDYQEIYYQSVLTISSMIEDCKHKRGCLLAILISITQFDLLFFFLLRISLMFFLC